MSNKIVSIARQSSRLICVWVPTGNPRMPLTCFWLLRPEDSTADAITDRVDAAFHFSIHDVTRADSPPAHH
jgi:hypothetical protein